MSGPVRNTWHEIAPLPWDHIRASVPSVSRPAKLPPLSRAERQRAAQASRERSDGRNLLSVIDTAKYLGVDENTVYRLIHAGKLRSTKVGARLRLRPSDVDDYLDRNIGS